jgi:hypothetical protein
MNEFIEEPRQDRRGWLLVFKHRTVTAESTHGIGSSIPTVAGTYAH